jgi:hypothetical protein
MQWSQQFLEEFDAHSSQLGLKSCAVCDSERAYTICRRPALVSIGGVPDPNGPPADVDTDVLFVVMVECQICGHLLWFNSARFRTGDEPILT